MPSDSASVLQLLQLGAETTPGVAVAATKKLPYFKITHSPDADFTEFGSSGSMYVEQEVMGTERADGQTDGLMGYGDIIYPLNSIVRQATPVVGGSGDVTWTFDAPTTGSEAFQTYTGELGDLSNGYQYPFLYWNELQLKFNKKSCTHTGKTMSQRIGVNALTTSGVAYVEKVPIRGTTVDIYTATSFANLASAPTKIGRLFDATFKIAKRFGQVEQIDSTQPSFDGLVADAPDVSLQLKLGARTTGSDFSGPFTLAGMRAGTTYYVRVKAVGPLITGSIYYTFILDMAVQISKAVKFQKEGAVQALGWDFRVVNDVAAGKPYSIKVINKTAAL